MLQTSIFDRQNRDARGGGKYPAPGLGGGGLLNNVLYGEAPPEGSNPYPLKC